MKNTYCIISAQYLPTMGGVENFSYNLAKQLIKNGHKCIIITSSLPNLSSYEIDKNKIEIIRLDSFNFLHNRFPFVKLSKNNSVALKNLLKYENLKFIINTRIYPLSLYTAKFAKKHNIPSILLDHSSYYLSLGNKFVDFIIKIYEHIFSKLIKLNCNRFFGVSKATCDWLKNFNINAEGVIYNSIDFNVIDNVDKKCLDLSKYNMNSEAKIICYAGRLIPEKGVDKLCIAFKELNLENVYLFFAGEGVLDNFINKNKNENTFLLGKLNFNSVISLFKQSDIFCLPTVSEGFPTTVLEACACSCYTITTMQSGGALELVSDENFGTLMPDNNIKYIKEAIINAINDDNLKGKAQNAKNKVLKNFTWEKTAQKVESLNYEVLN